MSWEAEYTRKIKTADEALRVVQSGMRVYIQPGCAEPETLVVRSSYEERESLIEDAPETYYLTDYYRHHPVVLVRLSRIERDALRDLLSVSWRLTSEKVRKRSRRHGASTTIQSGG